MSKERFSWSQFYKMPVVGIVRGINPDDFVKLLDMAFEAGLTTLEVTMNTPTAESLISHAVKRYGSSMNIGAGTVCTAEDLTNALGAGSQFIVTPIIDEEVIRECVGKGIPVFAGAYTPTEIYKAWSLGASVVKVFPATSLGPEFIKDLKGPMNHIPLLPTGGIGLDHLKAYAEAGAAGYGLGGALFPSALIKNKQWQNLAEHIKTYIQEIATLYPNEN